MHLPWRSISHDSLIRGEHEVSHGLSRCSEGMRRDRDRGVKGQMDRNRSSKQDVISIFKMDSHIPLYQVAVAVGAAIGIAYASELGPPFGRGGG